MTAIYTLQNVPLKLTCTDTPFNNCSNLSCSQCAQCLTIQLNTLIPLDILYSGSHNYTSMGTIWKEYFELFLQKIQPIIQKRNVLEIGCPSGKIALKANDYNKWFIVEPNKNDAIIFNENIHFIETFFGEHFEIDDKIDVIIHSHLFEHIYEPNVFLKKCYETLSADGEMFFGVPNMDVIAETGICPFLGIFFEHTIALTKENIKYVLTKNNFEIVEIIDYKQHSTLYHCRKKTNQDWIPRKHQIINKYETFMQTNKVYEAFAEKCNERIVNSNKDVYIFGASYNTQFLMCFGIRVDKIKGILDNSKEKQGKYLYGYELQIYDPNVLKNSDCIVILKNGYYLNEVFDQIIGINPNTEIIV